MDLQKLTKVEEEAMQLLWDAGRATVSDLLERFAEGERPPHSSLSSVVRILEKKGYVGHKAYGKTHEYFPLIAKEDYAKRSLGDLLRNYYGGSAARLVSNLVEPEQLNPEQIEELIKMLEK